MGLFGSLHRPSAYDADGAAEPLLAAEAAAPATAAGGGSRSPRTMWRAAARAAAAQRGLSQLVPPRGGGGAPAPASPRAERRRVRAAAIAEAFLFSLWPRPALAAAPSAPGSPGAAPSSPRSPGARACARAAAFAPATDARALAAMLRSSYLNVLLLAAPATFAAEAAGLPPTAVFCLSLAAIVPLALVLGEVTEDLALHYGDAVGGVRARDNCIIHCGVELRRRWLLEALQPAPTHSNPPSPTHQPLTHHPLTHHPPTDSS